MLQSEATVLVCQLELGISEAAVHEGDQFAHTGHEGDFGLLPRRPQLQLTSFEDAS